MKLVQLSNFFSIAIISTIKAPQRFEQYTYVHQTRIKKRRNLEKARYLDIRALALENSIFTLSSRHFQDFFKTSCKNVFKTSSLRLQDVLRTSWQTKNCYAEDVLKTNKCLLGSGLLKLGPNLNKRKKIIFFDQFWKEFCMEFSDFSIKLSFLTLFVVLTFQLLISTKVQGIMQPSIFEKHKICWNCTNSQLNQYYQQKQ